MSSFEDLDLDAPKSTMGKIVEFSSSWVGGGEVAMPDDGAAFGAQESVARRSRSKSWKDKASDWVSPRAWMGGSSQHERLESGEGGRGRSSSTSIFDDDGEEARGGGLGFLRRFTSSSGVAAGRATEPAPQSALGDSEDLFAGLPSRAASKSFSGFGRGGGDAFNAPAGPAAFNAPAGPAAFNTPAGPGAFTSSAPPDAFTSSAPLDAFSVARSPPSSAQGSWAGSAAGWIGGERLLSMFGYESGDGVESLLHAPDAEEDVFAGVEPENGRGARQDLAVSEAGLVFKRDRKVAQFIPMSAIRAVSLAKHDPAVFVVELTDRRDSAAPFRCPRAAEVVRVFARVRRAADADAELKRQAESYWATRSPPPARSSNASTSPHSAAQTPTHTSPTPMLFDFTTGSISPPHSSSAISPRHTSGAISPPHSSGAISPPVLSPRTNEESLI